MTPKTTEQAKKTVTLKKLDSLSKKNKANNIYCEFYYDFVWFFMDFKEKTSKTWTNLLCKNRLIDNLYMGKNTKKQQVCFFYKKNVKP